MTARVLWKWVLILMLLSPAAGGDGTTADRAFADGGTGSPADLVLVRAGSFEMGSPADEPGRDEDETPHSVTITRSFSIGRFEVTQTEYRRVVGSNPSRFKGPDLPVENVSWYEAVAYCNLRSESENLTPCYSVVEGEVRCDFSADGYRLPTEAEWEYAARGGNRSRGYIYSGGNAIDSVGWFIGNSDNSPRPVGEKLANELGIYDMTGNVSEWCWDWYTVYPKSGATDPTGPDSGIARVERGGGWYGGAEFSRTANRNQSSPESRSAGLGFRVVRSARRDGESFAKRYGGPARPSSRQ